MKVGEDFTTPDGRQLRVVVLHPNMNELPCALCALRDVSACKYACDDYSASRDVRGRTLVISVHDVPRYALEGWLE